MSDITPEKVAGLMAEWEAVYDESSNCWLGIESVEGNVARLLFEPAKITPFGEKPDAAKHFRAVVVPGETVPDLAEADRLKARLEAAEAIMRQCLAAVEHAEVAHLLGLYFDAAARADQAEQGGAA